MDKNEVKKQVVDVLTELDNQTASDCDVDYKASYYHLFNRITDTINSLVALQQEAEQMIINR